MLDIGRFTLVALGANQPADEAERLNVLGWAKSRIASDLAVPESLLISKIYKTPAYPVGIGDDFLNACVAFTTTSSPDAVLDHLHKLETEAGRLRDKRWGPRPLDLDLLAIDDKLLPDVTSQRRWMDLTLDQQAKQAPDRLILPHPRLQDRGFVLVPLNDVAPDWVHPVLKRTVREMLDDLPPDRLTDVTPLGSV